MSKQPSPVPAAAPEGEYDPRATRQLTMVATGSTIAYAAAMGSFLVLFADKLGFGPKLIGLLNLSVQAPVVLQLFMARYVDRHGGKRIGAQSYVMSAVALLPLIFAPQLRDWLGPTAATVAVFLSVLGYALCGIPMNAAWLPILRANLPDDRITQSIGSMNRVIMACALVATVIFGFFLGPKAPLWRYQAIFAVGALVAGLRSLSLRRVKELKTTPGLEPEPLWSDIGTLWRDVGYRRVILFTIVTWMAIGVSQTFRPLYITTLGFSARFAALLTVPLVLGAYGAASQTWGVLTDRYGSRGVYVLAGAGVVIGQILMVLPTDNSLMSGILLAAALAFMGASWGGFDSANLRRLFNIVPHRRQSMYLAAYTLTTCLFISIGSFLGGMVVSLMRALVPETRGATGFAHALDYRVLFLLTAVLIVASTGYSRRMLAMKEIGAGRLLLYFRIRTQRFIMSGVAGDLFRWVFPERERDAEERENRT